MNNVWGLVRKAENGIVRFRTGGMSCNFKIVASQHPEKTIDKKRKDNFKLCSKMSRRVIENYLETRMPNFKNAENI